MPSADESDNARQASVALNLTAVKRYTTLAEQPARWGDAREERGHLKSCVNRLEF